MRRSLRAFTAMPRVLASRRGKKVLCIAEDPLGIGSDHQAQVPVLRLLQVPRAATLKCGQGLTSKSHWLRRREPVCFSAEDG